MAMSQKELNKRLGENYANMLRNSGSVISSASSKDSDDIYRALEMMSLYNRNAMESRQGNRQLAGAFC